MNSGDKIREYERSQFLLRDLEAIANKWMEPGASEQPGAAHGLSNDLFLVIGFAYGLIGQMSPDS